MNNPDLHKIITEIATYIDCGMTACLDVDTAEVVYKSHDSDGPADLDAQSQLYDHTIAQWENKIEITPIDSDDEQEFMEYFIKDNVREGTRLYHRLMSAVNSADPKATFAQEVKLCKGDELWRKYRESSLYALVLGEIVETIGMPYVKKYTLDSNTIDLMALALTSGRYCYVTGSTVIISQVVDQFKIDPEGDPWADPETHYTIKEWALKHAEEHLFHQLGGGMVYEPRDKSQGTTDGNTDLAEVISDIKEGLMWAEDEKREFDDFCAVEDMVDDLWNSVSDDPEDYDEASITFVSPVDERRNQPDGKYPLYGKPDDEFSDDDPWGNSPWD